MKRVTLFARSISPLLAFVTFSTAAFCQNFYGTMTAAAYGYGTPNDSGYDSNQFYGRGNYVVEADDSAYPGVEAHALTRVRAEVGHLGIEAIDVARAGLNVPPSYNSAQSNAEVNMNDTIWFYTREVLYAQPLDIHLQARVDGTVFGRGVGALPNYGTYNGRAQFTAGIDGVWSASDSYSMIFDFNGTGMSLNETGDRLLDLRFRVPNTPNMRYTLRLKAEFGGSAIAYKANEAAPDLNGEMNFLFGNSLTWLGLISASSNGVPIEGPVVASAYYVDYNQSYDTTTPHPVPEPATYGLLSAGALLVLAALRRR